MSVDLSQQKLQDQREAIRRGLLQTNTAAVLVVLVIIGLALAAVLQANRAERERLRATEAEAEAREKLWQSYLAQARATRASPQAGRRFASLEILQRAAAMRPAPELRHEAAACLTLADLRPFQPPFLRRGAARVSVDATLDRYARGDERGRVELRQIRDDQLLAELNRAGSAVGFVHYFSPDGQFLPVRYRDGETWVWDVGRREPVLQLQPSVPIYCAEFSPDSQRLVTADEKGGLNLYDVPAGRLLQSTNLNLRWLRVRYRADGRQLALFTETSREAWLVDLASGQVTATLPHPRGVRGLAWHPDQPVVATACDDGKVYVWAPPGPEPRLVLAAHQSAAIEVDFHPQGELLASAGWDGAIRLWDVATGEASVTLPATGKELRFSRDGRHLSFYWGEGPALFLAEVAGERVCRLLGKPGPAQPERSAATDRQTSVAFSPDERLVASGHADGFRLWDARSGRELAHAPGRTAWSVCFPPDGQSLVVSGEDGLWRWPVAGLLAAAGTNGLTPEPLDGAACKRASLAPDGSELAYIRGTQVHLLKSGRAFAGMPAMDRVALSGDGRWLAGSAWFSNGGRLWSLATGDRVRDFSRNRSDFIGFSPDSRWLITGGPEDYSFWDVETGAPGRRLPREHTSGYFGVFAFSPDGGLFACTSSRTQVQLFDAASFQELARLEVSPPQMIGWLAFNASGSQLAAATFTPFVQLWDLRRLRLGLAGLGLDWSPEPSSLPGVEVSRAAASPVTAKLPSGWRSRHRLFTAMALGGVVLAILLAFSVLRRQRALVESYRRADDLAVQQRRELEAAQAALFHSQKMKALGTLAAGIAHDFNNLLSVIRMANQLVERAVRPTGVTRENIDAVEHAVAQGQQIVRSMLGYSRAAADERQAFSVPALVGETVALLGKKFLSGIVLTLELDPDAPGVTGSRARLEQMLLNLVVNAAEAMDGQGKLCVSLRPNAEPGACVLAPRPADAYLELAVADSGPGIPPEVLPRIFEPFFTTKTVGANRGTGLGLSTVYTLAQHEGWGVGVDTSPGEGATFRILIPVAAQ